MKKAYCSGPKQRSAFRNNYPAAVIAVMALLLSSVAQGQNPTRAQLLKNQAIGFDYKSIAARVHAYVPLDTLSTLDSGAVAYKNGALYFKNGVKWLPVGNGADSIHIYTATDPDPDTLYQYKGGDSTLVGLIPKGDNWGSQVVQHNTTLTGSGTSGDPLNVDTIMMATRLWHKKGIDSLNAALRAIAFLQDGNSFGDTAIIGTNDNWALAFETNNVRRAYLVANGLRIGSGSDGLGFGGISLAGDPSPNNFIVGEGFNLSISGSGSGSGAARIRMVGSNPNAAMYTSGDGRFLELFSIFSPTSGTATYTGLRIRDTINQTGGASGITRGIMIDDVLTSAADYRALELTNNTGLGLYQSGTANNRFNGKVFLGNVVTGNVTDSILVKSPSGEVKKIAPADIATGGGGLVTQLLQPLTVHLGDSASGIPDTLTLRYGYGLMTTASDTTLITDTFNIATRDRLNKVADSIISLAGGGGAVSSVFGRTGAVTAQTNDYTWAQIDKTTSSLADITTRSASDLSSGTLADGRLSSNVPLKNASNTFTNSNTFGTTTINNATLTLTGGTAKINMSDQNHGRERSFYINNNLLNLNVQKSDFSFQTSWSINVEGPANSLNSDATGRWGFAGQTTLDSWLNVPASTTSTAGLKLPHGSAPTSPVNGQIWSTTSGFFNRTNGTTYQFATLTGTETFTNKTLTTPTIGSFTNATHNHTNAAGGGQLTEGALNLTDVTTANTSTTAHGFAPKLSGSATQYLDGTGNWSTPAGGGGGSGDVISNETSNTDGQLPLFGTQTDGKHLKKFTSSGLLSASSGVVSGVTTSAGIASALSDEVGSSSGLLVFNNAPSFQNSITSPIVYGSSSSGGDLTLASTSNATKGQILLGSSQYDETTNSLCIGCSTTSFPLQVTGKIGVNGYQFVYYPAGLTDPGTSIGIGEGALASLSIPGGVRNVGIGYNVLNLLGNGFDNTAIGNKAMDAATTAAANVAAGKDALGSLTIGQTNTAVGALAGSNGTTLNRSIAIGYNTQFPSATASNQMNIGNTLYSTTLESTTPLISWHGVASTDAGFKFAGSGLMQVRLGNDADYGDLEVKGRAYDASTWNGSNKVVTEDAVRDKIEAGISTSNSITGNGTSSTPVKLVNDVSSTTKNYYYGTNESNTRGWNRSPTWIVEDIGSTTGTSTVTYNINPPTGGRSGYIQVTATGYDAANSDSWTMTRGIAYKRTGSVLMLYTGHTIGADDGDAALNSATLTFINTSNTCDITITGVSGKTIRWSILVTWLDNPTSS